MTVSLPFDDRQEAGRLLADRLVAMKPAGPVVLALPRGGVPVAAEIAGALGAALDLVLVRKVGVPFQPELAAAAVVDGDHPEMVVNGEVVGAVGLTHRDLERLARPEFEEIERRRAAYLGGRPPVPVAGRTAILVDDGLATGASMRAALAAVMRRGAERTILAVPVAPADTLAALAARFDDVVCLATPDPFFGIGGFYADFHQVPDGEVIETLEAARSAADRRGEGVA